MTLNQEVIERPERRRREGRRSVRFTFGRRSSLFCVPVFFLYLCLLWVSVFFGFYVGPAKLQRGATPPSVMVLFEFGCYSWLSLYKHVVILLCLTLTCRFKYCLEDAAKMHSSQLNLTFSCFDFI